MHLVLGFAALLSIFVCVIVSICFRTETLVNGLPPASRFFSDRRQSDPIDDQDYLWHTDLSFGARSCSSHRIGTSPRQNFRVYQSLTHPHWEVPKHRLKKDLVRPMSGFMGLILGRIFLIFGFLGCSSRFRFGQFRHRSIHPRGVSAFFGW